MSHRAAAVLTGPISQTGTSLSMDQPLHVLSPGDVATLPAGASPQLRADLTAGKVAVVPGDPATSLVWWMIDPATGATRSVVAPGYGGQVASGSIRAVVGRVHPGYDAGGYLPPGPYTNGTVNTGGRIFAAGIDDPILTRAEMDQLAQEAVKSLEAQRPPPPQGGCGGGSEYVTTLCVVIIGALSFAVLGVVVYVYMSFF